MYGYHGTELPHQHYKEYMASFDLETISGPTLVEIIQGQPLETSIQSKTTYYKLQAYYPSCNTRVVWVSTSLSLSGAPSNPCLTGGSAGNLVILNTWTV